MLTNLRDFKGHTTGITAINMANGNNANVTRFNVVNSAVRCVQIDPGFTPNNDWDIPPSGSFSETCEQFTPPCFVAIPDANFKAALVADAAINTNGNSEIECDEASAFTGEISVQSASIIDMTGIEAFTSVTSLKCNNNQITTLDVSNNTELVVLACGSNQLTTLDVTNNPSLRTLSAFLNQLTTLDLSANTDLDILSLGYNNLSAIDVSANSDLTLLYLEENMLSSLDISNLSLLELLTVQNNQLGSLDTTNNEFLLELQCWGNQLTSLDLSGNLDLNKLVCSENQITTLDLSLNTSLNSLFCQLNNLTVLNLANGNNSNIAASQFRAEGNPSLTCIQIDAGFTPPSGWSKDSTASYSDNCNGADTTPPVANCQNITVQLDANGEALITATQIDNGSTDNVALAAFSITPSFFNCNNVGANTVMFTATDTAGNTDTCTATVTIVDNIGPAINCSAAITVTVDEGVPYTIPDYGATGDVTATDNCSVTISQSPSPGTQFTGSRTESIIMTATDGSGNTTTCAFNLTIDETLSTADNRLQKAVQLYPNPAVNTVYIDATIAVQYIEVYTIDGQKVVATTAVSQLDIAHLHAGIYFVNIQSEKGWLTKKLIKK